MQLVLINISDHSTRVHANGNTEQPRTRVLGCLLGQQTGRVVDIINSLEIRYEDGPDGITIDEGYLAKKQEQCMPFPSYAVLQLGTLDRQDRV